MRALTTLLTAVAGLVRLDLTMDLSDTTFDIDADAVTADLVFNQS